MDFGMAAGRSRRLDLAKTRADKGPVWDRRVAKYRLQPHRYDVSGRWPCGDFVFTPEYDIVPDTGKVRRHEFHEYVATGQMFYRIRDGLRADRAIPP